MHMLRHYFQYLIVSLFYPSVMSVSVKIKIKHLTENVPSCTLMTTHNHNIYLTKRFPTTVDHGLGTHSVSHESLTLVFSVLVAY